MNMKPVPPRAAGDDGGLRPAGAGKRPGPPDSETPEANAMRLNQAMGRKPGEAFAVPVDKDSPPEGLSSMFSQALGQLSGQTGVIGEPVPMEAGPSGATAAPLLARQCCEELVERILASPPSAEGSAEVRIRIDKPWLPETEVRLTMSSEGRLEVDFQTDSGEAQRFLLPNLDTLRDRLGEKCAGGVAVRMTENTRENGGDGRSRNRRSLIRELDGE